MGRCVDLHFYLHHRVVSRDVDREQVKVPGGKDERKQHLGLPGDACRKKKMTTSNRKLKMTVLTGQFLKLDNSNKDWSQ